MGPIDPNQAQVGEFAVEPLQQTLSVIAVLHTGRREHDC